MKRSSHYCHIVVLGVIGLLLTAAPVAADDPPVQIGAEVVGGPVTAVHVNVDLRDLPPAPEYRKGDPVKDIPRRFYPHPAVEQMPYVTEPDALAEFQASVIPTRNRAFTTPNASFGGQGYTGVNPPDTVGDIGPNYYIQSINGSGGALVRVYNKDGSPATSAFSMESLGTGNCASGYGDPIILYDRQASRWFMQEFSQSGNYMCVYISQTSNPVSGGWYHYSFAAPNFPDYPHFGIWSDAYYATSNESGDPPIYAWDRANMLIGGTARAVQRFTASSMSGYGFQALTPADLDGANAPPAGADGILARHYDAEAHGGSGSDLIHLYELNINWNTPASSALTGPYNIAISEYNSKFEDYSTFYSVPVPSTGQTDPIREVILNRLQYRNNGSYESLVGQFPTNLYATSSSSVNAAIRWFELRGGEGNWSLYQEGTFDPGVTTEQRWVGGISADSSGNIALAYSYADPGTSPSINYTGRLSTDPLNAMSQPETRVVTGSGTISGNSRWGDYASMNVDPEDDCTFWYTTEYYTGSWATHIVSFTFDACGCAITVNPVTINAYANGDNRITVTWNDSSTSQVTQYDIYRSLTSGGGYVLQDTVADDGGPYSWNDDTVSAGVTYYYVVYASDGDACISGASNESSATATGQCLLPPTFGGVTSVTTPNDPTCTLEVAWGSGSSLCGNGVEYSVWRSTSPGIDPDVDTPVQTGLTGTSYQDSGSLVYDTTYYYVVRAVDDGNGVDDGNVIEDSGVPRGALTVADWDDDLESYGNLGQAESAGWSHGADAGTDDWAMPSGDDHTTGSGNAFSSADVAGVTDKFMVTDAIGITATSVLTFWHKFDFEDGYDGGVLEISINGGSSWSDLGTYITAGGYNDTISTAYSNPIGGQNAWSMTQASFAQVTVNLSAFDGETAMVRWRMGCDTSVSAGDWLIDDFYITDAGVAGSCTTGVNTAPTVTITAPTSGSSYDEGANVSFAGTATDAEDGNITASITWTSSIDGSIGSGGSFSTTNLSVGIHTITASVTDSGSMSDTDQITVTINEVNLPPVVTVTAPTSGSSYNSGENVSFTGTAIDSIDGDLTANLNWTSSIDGAFGTGGSVATTTLSVGTHTITAWVTDSGSLSGQDQITVTINSLADPIFDDGFESGDFSGWTLYFQ